jgi:hypothetical protein
MNLFKIIDKLSKSTVCLINKRYCSEVEIRNSCLDETATVWTMNEETKCRERELNYKIPFDSTLVGKGIISTREKQVIILL